MGLVIGLLFLLMAGSSIAQSTIWSENFDSYANGTTVGTANKWTLSGSPNGYFYVSDANLTSKGIQTSNADANMYWLSQSISITGYTNVTISFDAGEIGNSESDDFIRFEYSLNGGSTWITVHEENDDFTTHTFSVAGISGTNLLIRIILRNNSPSEIHWIDNVLVQGTATSTPLAVTLAASPSTICLGQSITLTATASGGTSGSVVTGSNSTLKNDPAPDPGTVSSTITLGAGALTSVNNISVSLRASHTWVGDITATLSGPCGSITLFNRPNGGTGSNSEDLVLGNTITFTSTGVPFEPTATPIPTGNYYADFSGLVPCANIAGNWTLTLSTPAGGHNRDLILEYWSISITSTPNYSTTFSGPGTFGTVTYSGTRNSVATVTVTPTSAGTATYTATTTDGSTNKTSSPVNVTVNTVPTITGTTPGSRVGPGTVVLGATASAGTINWYDAPTGGTLLGTGTSFTTPSISTTTTYYAQASNNGCTSARTAVVATILNDPDCPVISNQNTIYGNVFEDIDGDGLYDGTESNYTVSSITIYLYEDANGNGLLDDGAPVLQTTTTDGAGKYQFDLTSSSETVRDEFNSQSYSLNNGSQNWNGDWIETDPYGAFGPIGNYVGIDGGRLFFHYSYAGDESIRRSANLSGATSATLTFDWETVGLDFGEELSIQVSSDGSSFTTIGTMGGNTTGAFSYDISAYISANTTIRFYNEGNNWESGEYTYLDNVQISYDGGGLLQGIILSRLAKQPSQGTHTLSSAAILPVSFSGLGEISCDNDFGLEPAIVNIPPVCKK